MKRTAWLVGVVVCAGIGVFAWQRHRAATSSPSSTETTKAATSSAPPHIAELPPAPDPQTAEHEQQETADAHKLATDLQLSDHERDVLLAALSDLQVGRRALFADLAAKRINADQVSTGLHELRTKLRIDLERELGADRAKQILDRMREDHR